MVWQGSWQPSGPRECESAPGQILDSKEVNSKSKESVVWSIRPPLGKPTPTSRESWLINQELN